MDQVLSYKDSLEKAMTMLASDPRTIFMGQSVKAGGTGMSDTLSGVSQDRLLELPVFEDMQMGMAIGMALEGLIPICIFPRYNFLLLAVNQLVNHLDRLPRYSQGRYQPKVIIRTAVGAEAPLFPGAQHIGNFGEAFRHLLKTVYVHDLYNAAEVIDGYKIALEGKHSSLLVEYADEY